VVIQYIEDGQPGVGASDVACQYHFSDSPVTAVALHQVFSIFLAPTFQPRSLESCEAAAPSRHRAADYNAPPGFHHVRPLEQGLVANHAIVQQPLITSGFSGCGVPKYYIAGTQTQSSLSSSRCCSLELRTVRPKHGSFPEPFSSPKVLHETFRDSPIAQRPSAFFPERALPSGGDVARDLA